MSKKSGSGVATIGREIGEIGALAASAQERVADTGTISPSVADEAIREIGQQISQTLSRFVPSGGKFPLDIDGALRMYGNHVQTHENLSAARVNEDGGKNRNERMIQGKTEEEFFVHDQKMAGHTSHTTDKLAKMKEANHPEHEEYEMLRKAYPEIEHLAQTNHAHTDVVTVTSQGIMTAQVKKLDDPASYFREFKKDSKNDQFVVPSDKFESVKADLEKREKKGGEDGRRAKEFLQKLKSASVGSWATRNPTLAHSAKVARDAATRTGSRIGAGVATDVALIAMGGVAWEIREAYRDPDAMTLMERVSRLLRVVWSKIQEAIKDRSLREIGFEALSMGVSMLAVPLKMAQAALVKILGVVQRLWMEFIGGKIKSLADVLSAILQAVYSVACIGVAITVERYLSTAIGALPGGEMLSAVLAAAVAGVIIVIGNRGIETIVYGLAKLSARAELARRRREEIEQFCAQAIPQMIADRERLEELIDEHLAERRVTLDRTFADMGTAWEDEDLDRFLDALKTLNAVYGKALPWSSQEEFDALMLSDKPLKM